MPFSATVLSAAAVTTLAVVLCLCGSARAWGPWTHQAFGDAIFDGHANRSAMVMGSSSPDAFKKLGMHDWEFAGFMVQQELAAAERLGLDAEVAWWRLSFALGYGAHFAEDYVGHHEGNGYLTPASDHELEFAVDTYQVKAGKFMTYEAISRNAQDAVLEAAQAYVAAGHTDFPLPTAADLEAAANAFNTLTTTEALLIEANFLWEGELVKFDRYGAVSLAEAEKHLADATACSVAAGRFWIDQVSTNTTTPADAVSKTQATVDAWFVQGSRCGPP